MIAVVLALLFAANALTYQRAAQLSHAEAFEQYNSFWNKTHSSIVEKAQRFANFKMNARKIDEMNARSQMATFGYTKFSDFSVEEFKGLLGFRSSKPLNVLSKAKRSEEQNPSSPIDWVAKGKTTPVKDQGQCGSCWAFSTTETVESANLMAGKNIPNGSPQEIVDCDSNDAGCNGGDPGEALQWVINQGGLDTDSCYPYTAQDGSCASSQCTPTLMISSVIPIDASSENNLYAALGQYGPLSICCDAEPWQNYQGGILTADQCGDSVDHAIQLTGYSPSQGGYWIVRNSWGADWGENGFIYLQYGQDTCAITSEVNGASA
jgi:C1A family cysteine protease